MSTILKKITLMTAMILSFVSFCDVAQAKSDPKSSTKDQSSDEFAAFGEEIPVEKPAKKKKKSKDDDLENFSSLDDSANSKPVKSEAASAPVSDAVADQAQQLMAEKKSEEAVQLLWKNIEKASPKGFALLGKIYQERQDYAELAKVANLMIGKNNKDYRGYTFLAESYRLRPKVMDKDTNATNEAKALENYNKALEINKKYEAAHWGLVKLYDTAPSPDYYEMVQAISLLPATRKQSYPKSNYFELRTVYQEMITALGKRPDLLAKLCEVNTLDEAHEMGLTACKDAIAADSKIPESHVYLGICYKETGADDKALEAWKYASKKFPNSEIAQFYYGKSLEESKNYVEAMKVYAVGTAANKKSYRSWLGFANSAFELRKYDMALDAYKAACSLNRSATSTVRKAAQSLRSAKSGDFATKYDTLAENCGL